MCTVPSSAAAGRAAAAPAVVAAAQYSCPARPLTQSWYSPTGVPLQPVLEGTIMPADKTGQVG
jgi:hypothetical protein